jgi:soluble lytic murein transglycosylase-like protein
MFIALQVRTNEDTWFTLAARNAGESREAELLARVEMVKLKNDWLVSGYFPNGAFRIARV